MACAWQTATTSFSSIRRMSVSRATSASGCLQRARCRRPGHRRQGRGDVHRRAMRCKERVMLSPPKLTELRMLWETCAAGGLSPTTTVEQISYLLLLKSLSDQGSDDAGDDYRWEAIIALARQRSELCLTHLRDVVFPWLRHKELEAALPGAHGFLQHAHLAFNKPTLLAAALADIDTLFATDEPGQHAIIYDRLLSMEEEAIASSARPTGRIFTPDHISKLLCLLVDVRGDDLAWEPSCGNAISSPPCTGRCSAKRE